MIMKAAAGLAGHCFRWLSCANKLKQGAGGQEQGEGRGDGAGAGGKRRDKSSLSSPLMLRLVRRFAPPSFRPIARSSRTALLAPPGLAGQTDKQTNKSALVSRLPSDPIGHLSLLLNQIGADKLDRVGRRPSWPPLAARLPNSAGRPAHFHSARLASIEWSRAGGSFDFN